MLMTVLAGDLAAHTFTALRIFQAQDSINSGNSKLLMVFIGIAALALLVQAMLLAVFALGAMKAQKELGGELKEFRHKASAFIDKANALTVELAPQVRDITARISTITNHIEKIAALVDEKAAELSPTITAANKTAMEANETVAEANRKTREQVNRVNGMLTTALDATARLGVAIEKGITVPGREVAGIFAGLRAGIDTLVSGARAFGSGSRLGSSSPRLYPPPARPSPRPVSPYSPEPTTPAYFRPSNDIDL